MSDDVRDVRGSRRGEVRRARIHIERLRRRADFLTARIEEREQAGLDPSWDLSERSSLLWAIAVCEIEWEALARSARQGPPAAEIRQ